MQELFEDFLAKFPFNYRVWNKYAQLYADENSDQCFDMYLHHQPLKNLSDIGLYIRYTRAVHVNPRSLDLWNCFCSWLSYVYGETNTGPCL